LNNVSRVSSLTATQFFRLTDDLLCPAATICRWW